MPDLSINNFKGVNLEEGLWSQGYSKYTYGMDIFGLQDNPNLISYPGTLQGAKTISAGSQVVGTSAIRGLVRDFAYYPTTGTVWGIDDLNDLYERSGGQWTLRRSAGDAPALNSSGGGGIAAFNARLYVADNANLNYQSGAFAGTWATLGTFNAPASNATSRPMKANSTFLFVGNNNLISKVDTSNAFTAAALTLPPIWTIADIELFGDRILLSTDTRTATQAGNLSRLWIWDGVSTTIQSYIDILDEGNAPYLVANEGMIWLISNRGATTPGLPIYTYNGFTINKIMQLPMQIPTISNVVTAYRGGLLIGSTNTGAAVFEDGVAGVWMINRYDSNHPYQAAMIFPPISGNAVLGYQIGAVYASEQNIFFSTSSSTGTAIQEVQTDLSTPPAFSAWQSLPIDAGDATKPKMWHAIQIDHDLTAGGATQPSIVVKVKADRGSFVTIKTITPSSAPNTLQLKNAWIPISRTAGKIEIRLELLSSTGIRAPRIYGFSLAYSFCSQ